MNELFKHTVGCIWTMLFFAGIFAALLLVSLLITVGGSFVIDYFSMSPLERIDKYDQEFSMLLAGEMVGTELQLDALMGMSIVAAFTGIPLLLLCIIQIDLINRIQCLRHGISYSKLNPNNSLG